MRELVEYLETLTVTQGREAGERFKVLPWQRRFIRGAFAPGVGSSSLSIARANGKSTLLAGIATATLDGPLHVPRGETVVVASSFEQARIIFDHVLAFLGDARDNRTRWRIWDSPQAARIQCRETGAMVRCIGSDPRRAHGLAPILTLLDEGAQWPPSTGEKMLAALITASGKQPAARLIALGTKPADPGHWFAKMLGGGCDYAQTHAARPDDPRFRQVTWLRANPSLPFMPDLLAALKREAAHAKRDSGMLAAFESLRLNLGTPDTERALLIEAGTWERIEGRADLSGRCVWGCDLGTSAAMSAIACYAPATGALAVLSAFPTEPSLAERGLRDAVGRAYQDMHDRRELMLCGGRAVDLAALLREGLRRFGPPAAIAADRWREAELRDALKKARVPPARLVARGQGYKDGGEDVRAFRRACAEGKVTPAPSLLLRYAMSEARTVMDASGNSKLAKNSDGGRRMRARDDAAAAAVLAVALGVQKGVAAKRRPWRSVAVG